ncbi:MAG: hypothetical protein ACRCST_06110 [Turicibacter sp.]
MSKWMIRVLILVTGSVPYVYLAMNDDASNRSMIFYGAMVISLSALTLVSIKTKNIAIHIVGNLISFIISYFLVISHQTEKWSGYFKPFSAIGMVVFISCIVWIIQIIYISYRKVKQVRSVK